MLVQCILMMSGCTAPRIGPITWVPISTSSLHSKSLPRNRGSRYGTRRLRQACVQSQSPTVSSTPWATMGLSRTQIRQVTLSTASTPRAAKRCGPSTTRAISNHASILAVPVPPRPFTKARSTRSASLATSSVLKPKVARNSGRCRQTNIDQNNPGGVLRVRPRSLVMSSFII